MVGVHHIAAEIICLHSHINNKAPDASCTESFVSVSYTHLVDIKRQEAEIANIHHLLGKEVEMEESHDGIEDHGEA